MHTFARRVEHRVRNRGRDGDNRRFAATDSREIRAIEQMNVQLRQFAEARDGILAEARVLHLAIGKDHRFPQRRAEAHDEHDTFVSDNYAAL